MWYVIDRVTRVVLSAHAEEAGASTALARSPKYRGVQLCIAQREDGDPRARALSGVKVLEGDAWVGTFDRLEDLPDALRGRVERLTFVATETRRIIPLATVWEALRREAQQLALPLKGTP